MYCMSKTSNRTCIHTVGTSSGVPAVLPQSYSVDLGQNRFPRSVCSRFVVVALLAFVLGVPVLVTDPDRTTLILYTERIVVGSYL